MTIPERTNEHSTGWRTRVGLIILSAILVFSGFLISQLVSDRYENKSPDELIGNLHNRRAGQATVNYSISALRKLSTTSGDSHLLVEGLAGLLLHQDPGMRRKAVEQLEDLGPQALQPLVRSLRGFNPDERFDVWARNPSVRLRGTEKNTNSDPVELIVSLYGSEACNDLLTALTSDDEFVRANAAEALSYLRDERISLSLCSLLNDRSWYVRRAAAVGILRSGNAGFRSTAGEVLTREPVEHVAQGYKFLLRYADDNTVHDCLLNCLRVCGTPEMAQYLFNTASSDLTRKFVVAWTDLHGYEIKAIKIKTGGDMTHRYYSYTYRVVPK